MKEYREKNGHFGLYFNIAETGKRVPIYIGDVVSSEFQQECQYEAQEIYTLVELCKLYANSEGQMDGLDPIIIIKMFWEK